MIEIEDEAQERKPKDSETVAAEEAGVKNKEGLLEGLSLESTEPKLSGEPSGDNVLAGFQEYLDEGFRPHFSESREAVSLENTISRTDSLWDHLNWQATLTFFDPEDRELAERIIGDINEDGYLSSAVEELARLNRTTPEKIEALRAKIKTFDPVGLRQPGPRRGAPRPDGPPPGPGRDRPDDRRQAPAAPREIRFRPARPRPRDLPRPRSGRASIS